MLLSSPEWAPVENQPPLKTVTVAHAFPDTRQPCDFVDEPLVEIRNVSTIDAYHELGILPQRKLALRLSAARKLETADQRLPKGFSLVVLDAWRSTSEQESLIRHYGDIAVEDGFVASTDSDGMRAPHTTGGAVDLTLGWDGKALALGTDYDAFEEEAALDFYEGGTDQRLSTLRRILFNAMTGAGFAPYWTEWWHWSFGDDMWAWSKGVNALYEVVPSD